MYAIIETGGKQYRVMMDDVFKVEKLNAKVGDKVTFDNVVAVGGDTFKAGNPYVEDFAVEAEVLEQGKGDKVVIYKYKAKKDYRRKNGHRQPFTTVKIVGLGNEKSTAKSTAKVTKAADKTEKKPAAKADTPAKKASAAKTTTKPAAKTAEKKPATKTAVKASSSMKKAELEEIAKNMGLKIASKATKADILEAIETANK